MTLKEISEKTPISLGSAAAVFIFACGLIAWGLSLESKVSAHVTEDDKRVEKIETRLDENQKMFQEIRERLIRIEAKQ